MRVESRTGDVTVTALRLRAEGGVTVTAEQGGVALLTDKERDYERHVSSDTGALTWSASDKGRHDETVAHTLIEAGEHISITAGNGVAVEYHHTGDARADVRQLAATPGLEWMGGLLERDNVDWRAVQAVYDTWNKQDGGLGPAATLIIGIAASVATYGAASKLSMSLLGLTEGAVAGNAAIVVGATGKAASATALAMQTALTAGFVSLSSRVATGMANAAAGGSLKDTLSSVVSEDGARSLLAGMVLAGTLDTMASSIETYGVIGRLVTVGAVKASVGALVEGKGVETALLDAVSTAFSRYAAGLINAAELGKTVEIVLSGALGAAAAAAAGQDPTVGAMSSLVAALANSIAAAPLDQEQKARDAVFMELSECSYENSCQGAGGFAPLAEDELVAIKAMKINLDALQNNKSGLHAYVFRNQQTNQYALVVRGTEMTSLKDLNEDALQAFGLERGQYSGAAKAIEGLQEYVAARGGTVIAAGHSLGGGVASALAAGGLVDRAVTFNAAGVHDATIGKITESKNREDIAKWRAKGDASTTAYVSRGDMLTNLQDLLSLLVPTTIGNRILVDGGGLHGLAGIREAFAK